MEWVGFIALALCLCYSSYPAKTKTLEKKIRKLESKLNGGSEMSKLISELVGSKCILKTADGLEFTGSSDVKCEVLSADDEWIKISYVNKKKEQKTKIIRIDGIESIELAE